MTSETTPGAHERAAIQVDVYRTGDGFRWRIKSSKRGRRIISESSEGYMNKADAFRGLLLTTGGRYVRLVHSQTFRNGEGLAGAFEQGVIVRGFEGGLVEEIFVEYVSAVRS